MEDQNNNEFDPTLAAVDALFPGGLPALRQILCPDPQEPGSTDAGADTLGFGIVEDRWYAPDELETLTPWKRRTFEAWRLRGEGPAYSRIGGRILYRGADLLKFIESGRRPTASERRAMRHSRKGPRASAA